MLLSVWITYAFNILYIVQVYNQFTYAQCTKSKVERPCTVLYIPAWEDGVYLTAE